MPKRDIHCLLLPFYRFLPSFSLSLSPLECGKDTTWKNSCAIISKSCVSEYRAKEEEGGPYLEMWTCPSLVFTEGHKNESFFCVLEFQLLLQRTGFFPWAPCVNTSKIDSPSSSRFGGLDSRQSKSHQLGHGNKKEILAAAAAEAAAARARARLV